MEDLSHKYYSIALRPFYRNVIIIINITAANDRTMTTKELLNRIWTFTKGSSPREKLESLASISDFLTLAGVPFLYQRGSLRHYDIIEPKKKAKTSFTVNTKRNQWIEDSTGKTGSLHDFLAYYRVFGDKPKIDYKNLFNFIVYKYIKQMKTPQRMEVSPIRIGSLGVMPINKNDRQLMASLTSYGISEVTISNWCQELMSVDYKTKTQKLMLGFPTVNNQYYVFCNGSIRPLGQKSISFFGNSAPDHVCYVYDRPLDYLALREQWKKEGLDYFLAKENHLVINGEQNIEEAKAFLKARPNFREVKCLMPSDDYGKHMFAEINDACRGTAIDCSSDYKGYVCLSNMTSIQIPSVIKETYKQYLESQRSSEQDLHRGQQHNAQNNIKSKEADSKDKSLEKTLNTSKEDLYGPRRTVTIPPRESRHSGLKL